MEPPTPLRIACTPHGKDAFCYDALETGQVPLSGYELEFHRQPMSVLNRAALHGFHDVTFISSVLYPQIASRYAILSVGTDVGRGHGPVLVSREPRTPAELAGRPVGVPGIPTTSWFLLRCLCQEAVPLEISADRIADAVAAGEVEAGVLIHEELLAYPRLGLQRVADLGAEWCHSCGLPLPFALNVIRRDLGTALMQRICTAIRHSLRHGLEHPGETLDRVSRFGRGSKGQCMENFAAPFAKEDAMRMPDDVRMGLRVLFAQIVDLGLSPQVPDLDIVEGAASAQVPQAA
jgi:1,4-dihydroxy-6-naphthoate synthase